MGQGREGLGAEFGPAIGQSAGWGEGGGRRGPGTHEKTDMGAVLSGRGEAEREEAGGGGKEEGKRDALGPCARVEDIGRGHEVSLTLAISRANCTGAHNQ